MNYCHNCGNEKIANTKFCSFCGQPYAENAASQPQFQPATPAIPAFSPQFQTRVQPTPAEITVSGGGNIPAKIGLVFFLCAAVLTFILSFLTFWTFVQTGRELGEFLISGTRLFNSMGGTILCLIAVFLAVLAVLFSGWGIFRRYRKPERFGYLKTALTFFILTLGLLIIQLASVGYGMAQWYSFYYRKTPAYKPANNTGATVQAKDLFAAYQSSKAAADLKYKGRNIKVLGTIASAGTDLSGKVFVLFESGSSANFVRCNFPDSMKSAVSALKPNQTATFKGTVEGDLYGDVMIGNCSIEK